jgi:ribosomal protein S18 acetylase RimI-like enzyme
MYEKYFACAGIQGRTRKTNMSIILQNLVSPTIEEAIEANLREEMVYFGRAMSQGELHKTPELLWIYTGSSGPNAVLHSRFDSNDTAYIHKKISEMLDYFNTRHVNCGWTTGPSTNPTHLACMLETHGFIYSASTTGMAIDLLAFKENMQVHPNLRITEIQDLEALKILRNIEISGFGASEITAQNYYDMYAHAGFGNGMPWHHYIGWLHDTPVAIASLLFHAGVAGIFGIATIPEARRQGIGAAMALHTLREAQRQGFQVAVLSPTKMSIAIYRRIGFQEYCKLMHYEWSPET